MEFYNFRTISSHRRSLKLLFLTVLFFLALGPNHGATQQTDEEKRLRELFLKSRQKMEIVQSPTPSPKPTPSPAPSPLRPFHYASPETASPKSAPPSPTVRPSPTQAEEVPSPTPSPQPKSVASQAAATPPTQRESPSPTVRKKRWFFFGKRDDDSIVVQKSGAEAQKDLVPAPGGGDVRWQYLTPGIRKAIDDARVARNRWKYIIVHNSGTRQGNARIFDYYHRYVRRMPNGLAYHFVIGNGTSSGNGQIEIGNRWVRQLNGGHVHSDYLNYISIGICLVGDFNRDLPTKAEYEALDELIRYLRRRVGKVDDHYSIVRGHKEINPRPTDCPGNRFPLNWLHRSFPD
ncbi:MAG: N-acetylmuramoyl-L-alanine amidase [Verrucomicrobia bacterium]|nr:N-acetylmuramoyl-L-alanine amidase [Verrucomicrobiota bacterium]